MDLGSPGAVRVKRAADVRRELVATLDKLSSDPLSHAEAAAWLALHRHELEAALWQMDQAARMVTQPLGSLVALRALNHALFVCDARLVRRESGTAFTGDDLEAFAVTLASRIPVDVPAPPAAEASPPLALGAPFDEPIPAASR